MIDDEIKKELKSLVKISMDSGFKTGFFVGVVTAWLTFFVGMSILVLTFR